MKRASKLLSLSLTITVAVIVWWNTRVLQLILPNTDSCSSASGDYDKPRERSAALTSRNPQSVVSPSSTAATLVGQRILVAVLSYNLKQYAYFQQLLASLAHLCVAGATVHIWVYTTVVWPNDRLRQMEAIVEGAGCHHASDLSIEIKLKSPSWKNRLCHFHRSDFYRVLDEYDLFVYTEDDHSIGPRQVGGFLRETKRLEEWVGRSRLGDYSIGFIRYEYIKGGTNKGSSTASTKLIWESNWTTSTLPAFIDDHVTKVADQQQENIAYYFHGNSNQHQGMFMATPAQLRQWRDRCGFDDTWNNTHGGQHREKVSSLYLYNDCNVSQLIPLQSRAWQDFLIHHMSNAQHGTIRKYLPEHRRVSGIVVNKLESIVRQSQQRPGVASTRQRPNIGMIADDPTYQSFNLSNYRAFFQQSSQHHEQPTKRVDGVT